MSDMIFPPWLRISGGRYDFLSNTAASSSIFTGATRSVGRTGDRVKVAINTQNASDRETDPNRPLLKAIRAGLRGQANRIWYTDSAYRPRGSFPAAELLSNNTFGSGTTGWSSGTKYSFSVDARLGRMQRIDGNSSDTSALLQSVSVTQYLPYVVRAMTLPGQGTFTQIGARVAAVDAALSTPGMTSVVHVPLTTGAQNYGISDFQTSGLMAGSHFLVPYLSLSRCALVDNGANLLLHSEGINQAAWTKTRSSTNADSETAPDGTVTADRIIEDATASNTHLVSQTPAAVSSSAMDYSFSVALKAGTRTWSRILIQENTGSTALSAYFNLSTGAVGTTTTGANWSNLRTSSIALGNGWFQCAIVGRKTNAATSLTAFIFVATADNTASYTGDGTSYIAAWRATLAQSSVPTRLVQTTTTALPTGTVQSGPGYYLKGLPPSTNGLLLYGDWVQIGNQLCMVTAALNSDAAGLGYLQLAYPPRTAPADNAPVIIHQPMGRFILTGNEGGWDDSPGVFSSFDFDMVEALDQ